MQAVKTIWFSSLTKEEAEALKSSLSKSSLERDRFLQILKQIESELERKGFREEDYSSGGWTHLQAFRNGKLALIKQIFDLYSKE